MKEFDELRKLMHDHGHHAESVFSWSKGVHTKTKNKEMRQFLAKHLEDHDESGESAPPPGLSKFQPKN
jgi:hypothetical protein